jgi:hypothetical protein
MSRYNFRNVLFNIYIFNNLLYIYITFNILRNKVFKKIKKESAKIYYLKLATSLVEEVVYSL